MLPAGRGTDLWVLVLAPPPFLVTPFYEALPVFSPDGKHDLRFGVDIVRHELNHVQAEFGGAGESPGELTQSSVAGYSPARRNGQVFDGRHAVNIAVVMS